MIQQIINVHSLTCFRLCSFSIFFRKFLSSFVSSPASIFSCSRSISSRMISSLLLSLFSLSILFTLQMTLSLKECCFGVPSTRANCVVLCCVVLFFGLLLIYTFKVLVICGLIYICLIPFGYFSYQKIYKQKILSGENHDNDDLEDIL